MARGYMIRKGDKTSCGGQVLDGDEKHILMGMPRAREGDQVSCGATGQVYRIVGGVEGHNVNGRLAAGSLDSRSSCPCQANLWPSCNFAYESRNAAATLTRNQPTASATTGQSSPVAQPSPASTLAGNAAPLTNTESPPSTSSWERWTPELIAVAGSQHDQGSGNKMMFIGQAVRELAEFLRNKPSLTRTLVVFTPSYTDEMLSAARDSAHAYGAGIVEIATAQEFIDYLNQGKNREQSPIERLSLFSHGVPQQIAFGYQLPENSQMALDVLNYMHISPLAFSSTAQLDSFACRTGMGNRPDYTIEEAVQFFPQINESLAQLLANHLRIRVHAFIRRSDYKNTWGSFEERRMGDLCEISENATPGKQWCRDWDMLKNERQENHEEFRFTYQTMGAINPVISGETPVGIPGGHFVFLPK